MAAPVVESAQPREQDGVLPQKMSSAGSLHTFAQVVCKAGTAGADQGAVSAAYFGGGCSKTQDPTLAKEGVQQPQKFCAAGYPSAIYSAVPISSNVNPVPGVIATSFGKTAVSTSPTTQGIYLYGLHQLHMQQQLPLQSHPALAPPGTSSTPILNLQQLESTLQGQLPAVNLAWRVKTASAVQDYSSSESSSDVSTNSSVEPPPAVLSKPAGIVHSVPTSPVSASSAGKNAGHRCKKRAPIKSLSVEVPVFCRGPGELGWHPDLLRMTTIELNDFVNKSQLSSLEVKALKALRRRIKNRGYTRRARQRVKQNEDDKNNFTTPSITNDLSLVGETVQNTACV